MLLRVAVLLAFTFCGTSIADALECTKPDGSKFLCWCTDKDGQEQHAAKCAEGSGEGTAQ